MLFRSISRASERLAEANERPLVSFLVIPFFSFSGSLLRAIPQPARILRPI
jgi:hypothetical protein